MKEFARSLCNRWERDCNLHHIIILSSVLQETVKRADRSDSSQTAHVPTALIFEAVFRTGPLLALLHSTR